MYCVRHAGTEKVDVFIHNRARFQDHLSDMTVGGSDTAINA